MAVSVPACLRISESGPRVTVAARKRACQCPRVCVFILLVRECEPSHWTGHGVLCVCVTHNFGCSESA